MLQNLQPNEFIKIINNDDSESVFKILSLTEIVPDSVILKSGEQWLISETVVKDEIKLVYSGITWIVADASEVPAAFVAYTLK